LIVFGKSVRENDVKTTQTQQLWTTDKILPSTFKNFDTQPVVPPKLPHMLQDITMRFNDDMQHWCSRQGLEKVVNLNRKRQ
jgi:hypothetical protein